MAVAARNHLAQGARPSAFTRGDGSRPSACARGYGRTWQRLREIHLAENPLCVECEQLGMVVAAEEVDHIIPHRGNDDLLLEPTNLQSLCKRHHSKKTARGA